jgi:hypothetical protein
MEQPDEAKLIFPWQEKKDELISEIEFASTSDERKIFLNKMLDGVSVYPDIIIHHRGTKDNFVVIEAKKSNISEENESDKQKLLQYKSNAELSYKHGFFIEFPVEEEIEAGLDFEKLVQAV